MIREETSEAEPRCGDASFTSEPEFLGASRLSREGDVAAGIVGDPLVKPSLCFSKARCRLRTL